MDHYLIPSAVRTSWAIVPLLLRFLLKAVYFLHDIQWPPLQLAIDATFIFADDPQAKQVVLARKNVEMYTSVKPFTPSLVKR